jgi:hypothetical protein
MLDGILSSAYLSDYSASSFLREVACPDSGSCVWLHESPCESVRYSHFHENYRKYNINYFLETTPKGKE